MEHLNMKTPNTADKNFAKLAALFPNAVTEAITGYDEDGKAIVERAIDKDALMQEINARVVDGKEERYQFTWPDKKKSVLLANAPTTATLRPCREESVDFDTTQNLYIEGDNLEVLKLLKETYLHKVKMIYIDPPYNTGNDFVYEDDFSVESGEWKGESGNFDKDGNLLTSRMTLNTESNGRFHTDWLNMIYPRLRVAKDLLTDDGVIFISIDDNEVENLRKVCDEIFGEGNFVAQLVWERAYSPKNDAKYISNSHDYILMIARNIGNFKIGRLERTEEANARYSNPDNDPRGVWKPSDMSVKTYNASCDYPITTPSGKIVEPPAGRCWSLSAKAFAERLQDNRIWFGPDGNSVPCIKRFLTELKFDGMAPTSILFYKDVGHSQEGAQEVVSLFGDKGVFDGPKPVRLLQRLITLANLRNDSIVLDFFSGSATTAHALMKTNAEKNKHCKFILVQIPEKISEKKKDSGFKNICEIGKERIRRAGQQILKSQNDKKENHTDLFTANAVHGEEVRNVSSEPIRVINHGGVAGVSPAEGVAEKPQALERGGDSPLLDVGFRVLKLDSSNMKDVYFTPDRTEQDALIALTDNIKSDRTDEDLLFGVMLELGLPLSAKIEKTKVDGKDMFCVQGNFLAACFDRAVNEAVVNSIAAMKPQYAVLRDMDDDSVLTNFEEIFKTLSPDTVCKVL